MVTTDHIVNGKENSSTETENELFELCRALPSEKQLHASKLLRVFLEALNGDDK